MGKYHCTVDLLFGWLWNQLYDNWNFLFLFAKRTNPTKPVKQEVNGTVIFPPLVFPVLKGCFNVAAAPNDGAGEEVVVGAVHEDDDKVTISSNFSSSFRIRENKLERFCIFLK